MPPHLASRSACGDGDREGQRQLAQEVRVGRGETEGDRSGGAVCDDAARQVAAPSRLAPVRTDDPSVELGSRRLRSELEDPLDRPPEVARSDQLPVRVVDAWPEAERERGSSVRRGRERFGEVGDELNPLDSGNAPEGDEAVIRQGEDHPAVWRVGDGWIDDIEP